MIQLFYFMTSSNDDSNSFLVIITIGTIIGTGMISDEHNNYKRLGGILLTLCIIIILIITIWILSKSEIFSNWEVVCLILYALIFGIYGYNRLEN